MKANEIVTMTETPLLPYTLRLADTALVLGHRLSEWVGHSPVIEEDLAFGNMGLDLIGQARWTAATRQWLEYFLRPKWFQTPAVPLKLIGRPARKRASCSTAKCESSKRP